MPPPEAPDVLAALRGPDHPDIDRELRARRVLYLVTTCVLALLLGLAVVDAAGWVDTYGIRTARVRDAGGGVELEVRYATVSRPGLATPLDVTVHRDGGFDEPVTVAVDADYLGHWDEFGFYPTPTSETTAGGWLLWTFEPPIGEDLRFSYDGRITPSVQRGASGRVAVMDGAEPLVEVEFHTRVLP